MLLHFNYRHYRRVLGFVGIAGLAAEIAKILFFVFLICLWFPDRGPSSPGLEKLAYRSGRVSVKINIHPSG